MLYSLDKYDLARIITSTTYMSDDFKILEKAFAKLIQPIWNQKWSDKDLTKVRVYNFTKLEMIKINEFFKIFYKEYKKRPLEVCSYLKRNYHYPVDTKRVDYILSNLDILLDSWR